MTRPNSGGETGRGRCSAQNELTLIQTVVRSWQETHEVQLAPNELLNCVANSREIADGNLWDFLRDASEPPMEDRVTLESRVRGFGARPRNLGRNVPRPLGAGGVGSGGELMAMIKLAERSRYRRRREARRGLMAGRHDPCGHDPPGTTPRDNALAPAHGTDGSVRTELGDVVLALSSPERSMLVREEFVGFNVAKDCVILRSSVNDGPPPAWIFGWTRSEDFARQRRASSAGALVQGSAWRTL